MPAEELRVSLDDDARTLTWDGERLLTDGQAVDLTVHRAGGDVLYVRHKGRNHVLVVEDQETGSFAIRRADGLRTVKVADHRDLLLESLGIDTRSSGKEREVRAPMPGLVLDVSVSEGDSVAAGDALLVLEAMKMENEIRAQQAGVIARVHVNSGEAVVKNALLVEFQA